MSQTIDVAPALDAMASLKDAVASVNAPVLRLKSAFDDIGRGWRSAVRGLVTGRLSFGGAAIRLGQSAETGLIDAAGGALFRQAAGPLASLFGLGGAATAGANAAALAANTAALGALTAALGASAAASGAGALGAVGGVASLGLFAFARGGIVPSAAGGWALPNFAGAQPALLHAREMVLPAPISEGLQQMIGQGGGNGDLHLHFHGPADGPAVERWFTGLMARNPGVVRNMLRSNALTPRSL